MATPHRPKVYGYFPYGQPDYRRDLPSAALDMPLVRSGGVSIQRQPIILGEHAHPAYELHLITKGAVPQLTSSGEVLAGNGGEVTLMQPGVLHHGADDIIPKSALLWLEVAPSALHATRHTPLSADDVTRIDQRLRACGNTCARAIPPLLTRFDEIVAALQRFDDGDATAALELRALICEVLLYALRSLETKAAAPTSGPTAAALCYMAEHLDAPINVEDLARQVGLSPSRFHEVFKAETGLTPADHHLRSRIAQARRLLALHPDLGISSIATACGFTTARHFASTFKRFTGTTPTAFRAAAAG